MANVNEKLMKVQFLLKVPKDQFNGFGKYKYRNCEDVLENVKPILEAVKSTLTLTDDMVLIGDRFYLKATATFTDAEKGESISVSAFAREELMQKGMSSAQLTGSVSSYARKYALNGLFCIDDSKDDDSKQYIIPPTMMTGEQVAEFSKIMKDRAIPKTQGRQLMITTCSQADFKSLTEEQATKLINVLKTVIVQAPTV